MEKKSLLLFLNSGSDNTDLGDKAFHRRGEMIIKSRELEGLGILG